MGPSMRTIGFRSNILFAIAAACGVIAALSRPWYGPSVPGPGDGQMEKLWSDVGRALTDPDGSDGWTALHTADKLLAGLAVATVLLLVLALVPAIQRHVQALARWCALATVGVVLVKMIDIPGAASTQRAAQRDLPGVRRVARPAREQLDRGRRAGAAPDPAEDLHPAAGAGVRVRLQLRAASVLSAAHAAQAVLEVRRVLDDL